MQKTFEKLLGKNWLIKSILLLIATCWPIAFFWNQISFDTAKFTEEWIKIVFSGFVVTIVLVYYQHSFELRIKNIVFKEHFRVNIKESCDKIIEIISLPNIDLTPLEIEWQKIVTFNNNYTLNLNKSDYNYCLKYINYILTNQSVAEVDKLKFISIIMKLKNAIHV